MKYIIIAIVLISFGLIIYGFNLDVSQENLSHKYIGSGTLLLFLVAMPLFLIKESKGKKFNDYMLTDENVRKMQGKKPKNTDNQYTPKN
ncbi:hypothetical protein [Maribacter stanieri]|jgi:hypothetical protein|uniref:Uncharacterized protein n=1 Tax=Maribacter stanieri TaxID=440514 RepID=A0A1I6I0N1_9FLAO|nr:hypothetical protein [Maribacter stanieri]SFR60255.1 hypothetical protein SAMN04488010_0975 [Maribacter stanieri]|tara:strand:- start:1707 stop:1973 length:267 start_codon:yes stop_codon:yes gene_type:complete